MFVYYLMIIVAAVLLAVSSAVLTKNYQLSAGTDFFATVMLMLISGFVTVVFAAVVLFISREAFEATPYSLMIASGSTMSSVIGMFCKIKAYESGQVAIPNVFNSIGCVLISCFWGLLFLKEILSLRQTMAIFWIVVAILFITIKPGEKPNKHMMWIYLLIFISGGMDSVFSKIHQIEKSYATVNEFSFLLWVGAIRAIIFMPLFLFLRRKQGVKRHFPATAFSSAVGMTLFGSIYFIVTLIVAVELPITFTSPLSTGINVGLTALLPWLVYKEKMKKQEIIGVILSMMGLMLYV